MGKFQSYQIVKLSFLAALVLITPLLSTSMRPPYIYFLTNLLIIALGAEAGLLHTISKHAEDKKPSVVIAAKPNIAVSAETSPEKMGALVDTNSMGCHESPVCTEQKPKAVEKSLSEKFVEVVKVNHVKKCPSMPSMFFIGGSDPEPELIKEHDEEEEEEAAVLSGQELFTKAETFIGNFYKQLKIQREDSWKRIHGFYQKAFDI